MIRIKENLIRERELGYVYYRYIIYFNDYFDLPAVAFHFPDIINESNGV